MKILVLADTHDHLPSRLSDLAVGTDEIWHLGDVCEPRLLGEIEAVGVPVTFVRGNCDANRAWPLIVDVTRNGVRFRLIHIPPTHVPENIDIVLHGHTHVPRDQRLGGVRFLNPGCVTRPNRGAPPSVARLEISDKGEVNWQLIPLR